MKIYLAILEDHHTEDEIAAFTDLEMALSKARAWMKEYADEGYEIYEHEVQEGWSRGNPWLFSASLGEEDSVHVESVEVQ